MLGAIASQLLPSAISWGVKALSNSGIGKKLFGFLDQPLAKAGLAAAKVALNQAQD